MKKAIKKIDLVTKSGEVIVANFLINSTPRTFTITTQKQLESVERALKVKAIFEPKAKEEADAKAKEEEAKAKEEADAKAKEEADAKAKEEAAKAKEEADAKAKEEAAKKTKTAASKKK